MDVGQAIIAAGVSVSQFRMIKAHQMQNRGMKVVDVDWILDGSVSKIVGGSINGAAFYASASEPDGESPVIMIAASARLAVDQLSGWCPPKLASTNHQSVFKKATLLQVGQQGSDRAVALIG